MQPKKLLIGFLLQIFLLTVFSTFSPPTTYAQTWPSTPPAEICGDAVLDGGPSSPPGGAVTVAAGDNSAVNFSLDNTTYWFASGVHYLGNGQFDQIIAGDNSTYIGAPGAILDGQNLNNYAFTQNAANVRIAYLEIRNFETPRDEGAVNHDSGTGWTIEYNYIHDNGGAGVFAGDDNILRYNCLKDNGQYGFQVYTNDSSGPSNVTIDHNEVTGNNTDDWETTIPGCGCTGGAKFWLSDDVTVTYNWVHSNHSTGLWFDNNNRGSLIEHNYIEENEGNALFLEAGYDFQVRYNTFVRNAIETGRDFAQRDDPFPIGAIYISESGAPAGYGLSYVPSVISTNYFEDNWGGVNLWENADRYSGSSAHTHVSGTIKIGDLVSDDLCDGANDTIPGSITDEYDCRWSTENIIVEENEFHMDKTAIGADCTGDNYCGINGIFSNVGTYPEFSGYTIPWRITFQQDNIFRNNDYDGDWHFAGFQTTTPGGDRVTWTNWRAAAPSIPGTFTSENRPTTFGQDAGSTIINNPTPTPSPTPTVTPTPTPTLTPTPAWVENALTTDTSTIEGSVGNWQAWFSSAVSRSAEQAHGGAHSLKVTVTSAFGWGVELNNFPGFTVTPGEKVVSFWGLLGASSSTNVTLTLQWIDSNDNVLQTNTLSINPLTPIWQQAASNIIAPALSSKLFLKFTGSGSPSDTFYFDDFVVADVTPTPTPTVTPTPTAAPTPTTAASSTGSSGSSSSSEDTSVDRWKKTINAGPNYLGPVQILSGQGDASGAQIIVGKNATTIDLIVSIERKVLQSFFDRIRTNVFPWMQGLNAASEIYTIGAKSAFNGYPVEQFDKPVTIILPYDPAKLYGNSPRHLRIAWYDTKRGRWQVIQNNTVINTVNKTVANTTIHMTNYTVVYPAPKRR